MGKVRWNENDSVNQELKAIQLVQNKLLRSLNNVKISDKIRSQTLANNINFLFVNQLNAQIKITEMWKFKNNKDYPLLFKNKNSNLSSMMSRSKSGDK